MLSVCIKAAACDIQEPLLFSIHPSQLCALPNVPPVDQEMLEGFLRTLPRTPLRLQSHLYPDVLALGEQPRESRAAQLGHKVQGTPAPAAGPSGQLETPEHTWPLCGEGNGAFEAHPLLPWPDPLTRLGGRENCRREGKPFVGTDLPPLPTGAYGLQACHACVISQVDC